MHYNITYCSPNLEERNTIEELVKTINLVAVGFHSKLKANLIGFVVFLVSSCRSGMKVSRKHHTRISGLTQQQDRIG